MAELEPGTNVFVSYRRSGEIGFVGRLTDRLGHSYGREHVFRDISLRSGEDFETKIGAKLSEATVVIAVIGAEWVGRRFFRRSRIFAVDDWVRKELEHALASKIPVIPVLVGDVQLPTRAQLPTSLHGLLSVQVARIRDESWDNDFSGLEEDINAVARGSLDERDRLSFVWSGIEVPTPKRSLFSLSLAMLMLASVITIAWLWNRDAKTDGTIQLHDPSTWNSPQPSTTRSPIAYLALQLALLELRASTKEANGQNDGYNVAKFMQRFNRAQDSMNLPWSAAFVTWSYLEALKRHRNDPKAGLPFTDSLSTEAVARSLRQKGWLVEPFNAARAQPGDIVFFSRTDERIDHSEIVYTVSSTEVCSIGGNVGNQVSGRCRPLTSTNLVALGAIPAQAFE